MAGLFGGAPAAAAPAPVVAQPASIIPGTLVRTPLTNPAATPAATLIGATDDQKRRVNAGFDDNLILGGNSMLGGVDSGSGVGGNASDGGGGAAAP